MTTLRIDEYTARATSVTTREGITVITVTGGYLGAGWHVINAQGIELAHYVDPALGAAGALELYRRQCAEAERLRAAE